jgi:hypothetical protein
VATNEALGQRDAHEPVLGDLPAGDAPYSPGTGILSYVHPPNEKDKHYEQISFVGPPEAVTFQLADGSVVLPSGGGLARAAIRPAYTHPQFLYDGVPATGDTARMQGILNTHVAKTGELSPLVPGIAGGEQILITPASQLDPDTIASILGRQWGTAPEGVLYGTIKEVQGSGAVVFYTDLNEDSVLVGFPPSDDAVALSLGVRPAHGTAASPRICVEPFAPHDREDEDGDTPLPDLIGTILVRATVDGTTIAVYGPDVHLENHPQADNTVHHLRVLTPLSPDAAATYGTPAFLPYERRPELVLTPGRAAGITAVRALANLPPYLPPVDPEASNTLPPSPEASSGLPEETGAAAHDPTTHHSTGTPEDFTPNGEADGYGPEPPALDISDVPRGFTGLGWPALKRPRAGK